MIFKIWRWIVVVLLAIYAVISVGIPGTALFYKINAELPQAIAPEMGALIQSMHELQIFSWLLALLLYLAAAVLLARKRATSIIVAVLGSALDVGQWISLKYFGDAYDAAFSSGQQAFDWSLFGFLAFIVGSMITLKALNKID